jgi:hypothetical protein
MARSISHDNIVGNYMIISAYGFVLLFADCSILVFSVSTDKIPFKQEYICDICMQKSYNSNELQDHRKDLHSAAIGV